MRAVASQKNDDVVDLIPALRAFARTFCSDAADADDLVQETLTKALANMDKYQEGTRLKSWMFTIMRNTFYTRIKTYVREAPGAAACVSERPVVEATQEWSVRGREVHDAMNRLSPHHREVLMLIGVLGVSYEEAAVICSCAVGTIKSRLSRARLGVLEALGETSPETLVEPSSRFKISEAAPEATRRR